MSPSFQNASFSSVGTGSKTEIGLSYWNPSSVDSPELWVTPF
jgi:hypothetical protein